MPNFIPLSELASEEGRRRYYKVDYGNPDTLRNDLEPPSLDPYYNEELLRLYGTDDHGDQRIRIAWAADMRATQFRIDNNDVSIPYVGRKYPNGHGYRLRIHTGWEYIDDAGNKVTLPPSTTAVPAGKIATPLYAYDDLGTRKWVVEMKYTLPELVEMQWCPDPSAPDEQQYYIHNGRQYKIRPNPLGEYVFAFFIEDGNGDYADVTQAVLDKIGYVVNRASTESHEEYVARQQETWRKMQDAKEKLEEHQNSIKWREAFLRAEDKAARNRVYGV